MRTRRRSIIFGGIGLCLMVVVGTYVGMERWGRESHQAAGLPQAPPFSLPDENGTMVSLDDTRGRTRILYFWASWSPFAEAELPVLQQVAAEYQDTVTVLAINRDTSTGDGRAFLRQFATGLDPVVFVFDASDEYFRLIEGYAVPETLILDTENGVLWRKRGPFTEQELREALSVIR